MPAFSSQDLDKKLWTAADRLRSNFDSSVYQRTVLGSNGSASFSGGPWRAAGQPQPPTAA